MVYRRFGILVIVAVTLSVSLFGAVAATAGQGVGVSLVADRDLGAGARHGLGKVKAALKAKGVSFEQVASPRDAQGDFVVVVGLAGGAGPAARLHDRREIPKPTEPESLLIRRGIQRDKEGLLVSGADDRGLMYALLDVADRIGWAEDAAKPLSEVRDAAEKPAVAERALSIYTMHQANFESYFFDEAYWTRYLDMLAENRFNTFALLFGYENWGYFSPPYPYFFDVDEFPDVKVVGITKEKQQRNLKMLNRLIEMTHDRGLNFTLGIWDHIYRGGVQGPGDRAGKPTEGIVWGVTSDNLTAYTAVALAKFVKEVPDLDAIQFRMHGESGLKRTEMGGFWENVYRVMLEHAPNVRFDARAKNFPDSLIDKAVEMGVNMRICTKYWMEQMGLPFHPTHIHPGNQHDRRHGYADLLRYPQRYKMHWRLWTGGTTRVLLWADPEYVRRFAESTHLYNGEGFEVTEPMATKMQDHPHETEPFELLKPDRQYYDWEFERYWHFFQVFGRVGYNPDTPSEIWQRQFQNRFGKEAAPYVEQALHKAGKILPRIVAYTYPYDMFPTTRGWAERQRMKDLPEYAQALPSDTQQFLSIDNAAKYRIEGRDSAQFTPQESSKWFADISEEVLDLVARADEEVKSYRNKEFSSTMIDLMALGFLAEYHSHRAKAGLSYALFKHSKDLNALDDAIEYESEAIRAWKKLANVTDGIYSDNLAMGRPSADLAGHWRDELPKLGAGHKKLRDQRETFKPDITGAGPTIAHVPIRKALPAKDLLVRATVGAKSDIEKVTVGYSLGGGKSRSANMKKTGDFTYSAVIPGKDVQKGLNYAIEAGDQGGQQAKASRVNVIVTNDNHPPTVKHDHITEAPAEKPLTITAAVTDPSGVKWVRLRYRSVTQFEDYKTLEMTETDTKGQYTATVPGKDIVSKYDFMYLIEVMDSKGNGAIYPDMEKEAPYIIVKLQR